MSIEAGEVRGTLNARIMTAGIVVLLIAAAWALPRLGAKPAGPALTGTVISASWTAGKPGRYVVWVRITRRDGKLLRGNPWPDCVLLTEADTGKIVFHSRTDPVTEWWKRSPDGRAMDYYVEGTRSGNAPLPAAMVPLVEETRTPALRKRLAQWRIWAPYQFGPNEESGATYPLLPERLLRPRSAAPPASPASTEVTATP